MYDSVLRTLESYPRYLNSTFVDGSIFAPRRKEAESRSFFETERVIKKTLDADYGRMLKEGRVLRLLAKADAAVGRGQKTVNESLEEASMRAVVSGYGTGMWNVDNLRYPCTVAPDGSLSP